MKKYFLLILISIISCNSTHNYSLMEIKETSKQLNIPQKDLFYIDGDSLKKHYSGKKISLQNLGIKVVDSNLNVLKTKDGKCSIKKLNEVTSLEVLEIDYQEDNTFIKIYPNLSSRLKESKFTILCIWSKYYSKKVIIENIVLAREDVEKYKNCQILYLNADIYSELYKQVQLK